MHTHSMVFIPTLTVDVFPNGLEIISRDVSGGVIEQYLFFTNWVFFCDASNTEVPIKQKILVSCLC